MTRACSTTLDSNQRCGEDDPTKDAGLAVNWVLTLLYNLLYWICCCTTQKKLYNLYYAGVQIQHPAQHPHYITALLVCASVWHAPSVLHQAAHLVFPCWVRVVTLQFFQSVVLSLYIFYISKFTQRLAQVQCHRSFTYRGNGHARIYSDDVLSPTASKEKAKSYLEFMKTVSRRLKGNRPQYIGLLFFILSMLGIVVFTPERESFSSGTWNEKCASGGSEIVAIVWLFFIAVFYAWVKRFFELFDPYETLFRLKIATSIVIIVAAISVFINFILDVERKYKIGTSNTSLLFNKLMTTLQMGLWYLDSYYPLRLTQKRIEGAKSKRNYNGPSFLDTLTDSKLLDKFEAHLIEEWSIENLDYLKALILHQLSCSCTVKAILADYRKGSSKPNLKHARKLLNHSRRKAREIFIEFVAADAERPVNLRWDILREIRTYFEESGLDKSQQSSYPNSILSTERDETKHFSEKYGQYIIPKEPSRELRSFSKSRGRIDSPAPDQLSRDESKLKPRAHSSLLGLSKPTAYLNRRWTSSGPSDLMKSKKTIEKGLELKNKTGENSPNLHEKQEYNSKNDSRLSCVGIPNVYFCNTVANATTLEDAGFARVQEDLEANIKSALGSGLDVASEISPSAFGKSQSTRYARSAFQSQLHGDGGGGNESTARRRLSPSSSVNEKRKPPATADVLSDNKTHENVDALKLALLSICSSILNTSQVFDRSRQLTYDLLQTDSFPRFLFKLERLGYVHERKFSV